MKYDVMTMTEWNQYLDSLKKLGTVAYGCSNRYPENYTVITPMCDERNIYQNVGDKQTLIKRIFIRGA